MIAVTSLVLGAGFLIAGLLNGSEWVTVTGLILGLYGTADVTEKRNE